MGNLQVSIDVDEDIDYPDGVSNSGSIEQHFYVQDDALCCLISTNNWTTGANDFYLTSYDEDVGQFTDWTEITELEELIPLSDTITKLIVNDDEIEIYTMSDYRDYKYTTLKLITMDEDHECTCEDLSDLFRNTELMQE